MFGTRRTMQHIVVLLVGAAAVAASGAGQPRSSHTLGRRSAAPPDRAGSYKPSLPLKPKQKVKARMFEDIGRFAAECVCHLIRAGAMEKRQTAGLKAAMQHYAPVFTDELPARYCYAQALQRKHTELESLRLSSASGADVPEIAFAHPPYEALVTKHHYSIGYATGTCLCWKDVQDFTVYAMRFDTNGVQHYRQHRDNCRRESAQLSRSQVDLRYERSLPAAAQANRYRFVARQRPADNRPPASQQQKGPVTPDAGGATGGRSGDDDGRSAFAITAADGAAGWPLLSPERTGRSALTSVGDRVGGVVRAGRAALGGVYDRGHQVVAGTASELKRWAAEGLSATTRGSYGDDVGYVFGGGGRRRAVGVGLKGVAAVVHP